jgi:hypothetical protein
MQQPSIRCGRDGGLAVRRTRRAIVRTAVVVQTVVQTAVDAVVSAPHTAFNFVLGEVLSGPGFLPSMQSAATNLGARVTALPLFLAVLFSAYAPRAITAADPLHLSTWADLDAAVEAVCGDIDGAAARFPAGSHSFVLSPATFTFDAAGLPDATNLFVCRVCSPASAPSRLSWLRTTASDCPWN